MLMPYALYLDGKLISGPFTEKSEVWADATKRGLVTIIPSFEEDPPRRILDLNYSIRTTVTAGQTAHLPARLNPSSLHRM
jgi:hypothetical protein